MLYDIYHLGFLASGQKLSVKLNQTTNLLLIDDLNLAKYQESRFDYFAYEILQRTFSAVYSIPYDGRWHLILELGDMPSLARAIIDIREFTSF